MKRIFSFLLALAMVVCLLPAKGLQAHAAEVTEGDGTTAAAPVFIDSEEEWVYYLNNSTGYAYKHATQMTWYFKLTADIVLDAADEENGDTVNGTVGYTSTGKTTVIDLDGHTVTANGGTARFMAANSAGSSVTMKNGSVIVNRTGTSNNGSVFFINAGSHLTLENMTVEETGTSKYTGIGEFLYIGTSQSSATIKNTVIEVNTTNNSKDNAIYVNTNGASLDIQDSTVKETVHVTTTGVVTASGATKIAKLNLASTASAQAKADLSGLTAGARVRVAAGETAFTEAFENAENVLPYVKSADVTKKVAVADNTLVLVDEEVGDGSAEKPWLITSEADYVEHIFTNTTESGYYRLKDDIVLDVATDDEVNGNQSGSSTGRTINIDFDGYTVSAVGTAHRFFSCGAEGDLTLKNGSVIVNRTYKNSYGAVFNILNGGKLTLENMNISEIGTVAYENDGELLSVRGGSTVVITNTVMQADTTNNTNANTVYITGADSGVTFRDSTVNENVYVSATGSATVSGTTKIANVDLTSGALLTVETLTDGAQIGITAGENVPFTGVVENASLYAGYFTTDQDGMVVDALEDGTLAIVPVGDGSGASEKDPIYIDSNEEWLEYLVYNEGVVNTSQQQDWYFVLRTDLRIRSGIKTYGASGKNITIDFNGHTMNSANGTSARYMQIEQGSLTMKNGTVEPNGVSSGHGAVFYLDHSDLILENMQVDEYSATAYAKRGEIIYATASNITLTSTHITGVFTGNTSDYGAIYLREDSASGMPSVLIMVNSSLSCTETGEVGKGGWITAGKNTSVVMENSVVSGGAAQLGGNVYVGASATLTMSESTITGGTADNGADLYLLGSADVDATSVPGAMYVAPGADLDASAGALVTDLTTGQATLYATFSDAIAAYTEGAGIKLYESGELTVSCDAVVDVNGKNIAITGNGETKVTAFDSANSDYATYGVLTLSGAVLTNEFETLAPDGCSYYMLSGEDGYSFHRLDMEITGVALRTTTGGIYFKGVWNCDEALKAQIENFGVAVSLLGMPDADFAQSEDCLWTAFDGADLENGKEMTGVMIDGIVRKDREPALNDGYGRNYAICATTYVVFKNGETLVSDDPATTDDDVAVTLYSVVDGIEQMIAALEGSESQADQLLAQKYLQLMDAFYAEWKDYGLENWVREDFTDDEVLSAGFGRASIAPEAGTYSILGGNSIGRVTTETDGTEVSVSCVAVREGKETYLVYTVDVISVGSGWAAAMKTAVSNATGVAKENILIATTHTHSGVGVNYDWADHAADKTAYMEKFYAAAATAGTDAIGDMAQAQVLSGSVTTQGLAFVRHTSEKAQADGLLQLVQLQRADKKDIVLMSFPVHATFMEGGTVLSADFPGYARAYVEANYDAQVAYFIGSGGNQTPTSGNSTYKETAEDCLRYGQNLGAYAVAALNSGLASSDSHTLTYNSTTSAFNTNMLTEAELSKLDQAKEVKEAAETYGNTATQTTLLVKSYGFESVYQAKAIVTRSTLSEQKNMTLKVLALTRDVAVVFAPYEMFSNEGLTLKTASDYDVTFLAACSEANNGYIPSDYAWEIDGCYEVQVTRWEKGTAGQLIEAYTWLLTELKNKW